jgi:hypothetical protein
MGEFGGNEIRPLEHILDAVVVNSLDFVNA